jgi:hypothetical protein
MNWNDIGDILNQYSQGQGGDPDADFDRVAQQAPRQAMSQGVAEAFRSSNTPPFPNMLGQMFGQAGPDQRANILNSLLASLGPAVLSGMMSRGGLGGGGGLGGLLGGLLGSGSSGTPHVTPEQASGIPPQAVEEIAREAEQQDPSVIDRVSDFAAENPMLVKGLGAAALGIALSHLSKQKRGGLF